MFTLSKSLRAVAGALALATICAAPVLAADKTVLVTSIVEHPALDAVRDGTKDELKAEGFEAGKNLKWEFQSAQGNAGTAGQIARKFVGDNPDVIVAIATPSAQPLVAATKTIPIVYSAIADPIAAQLVKDWAPSGTNVTGLSHMLDPSKQVEILKKVGAGCQARRYRLQSGRSQFRVGIEQHQGRTGKTGHQAGGSCGTTLGRCVACCQESDRQG